MFGISLGKLFVIILVVLVVFWLTRRLRAGQIAPRPSAPPPPDPIAAEQLERCPTCAAFVPTQRTQCVKPGCPYVRLR